MGEIDIEGVIVTPLKTIFHPKGDIYHGIKKDDNGYLGFGEAYFSTIKYGETIVSYSAGGGGYGNPHHRDIERVAEDFNEGWISKERAKDAYGVIIDSNGIVNKEMTVALRG